MLREGLRRKTSPAYSSLSRALTPNMLISSVVEVLEPSLGFLVAPLKNNRRREVPPPTGHRPGILYTPGAGDWFGWLCGQGERTR